MEKTEVERRLGDRERMIRYRETGTVRFSTLVGHMKSADRRHGATRNYITTTELRDAFFLRHPEMIFRDDDGMCHIMTLESGPNQISADRINDKLPNGDYAPHTLENIRFVPLKLNVALKASPSDINEHKENTAKFICPLKITGNEREIIAQALRSARNRVKRRRSKQARGITVDPMFTIERAVHKIINDQQMRCAISGLVMLVTPNSPFTISMDRICNTKGYSYENVQFVCRFKQFSDGNVVKRLGETLWQTNERVKKLRSEYLNSSTETMSVERLV